MDQDFQQMASQNVTTVRTYYSAFYNQEVASHAHKYGVKLYLGVYMFVGHDDWTRGQVQFAIDAAKQYPETVQGILVGNENVLQQNSPFHVDDVIGYIQEIKSNLSNSDVKVGTSQRINEWILPTSNPDIEKLAAECDFVGANIYPFFSDTPKSVTNPVGVLEDEFKQVQTRWPDKHVVITETGWPSGGGSSPVAPKNVGTLKNEEMYWYGLKTFTEAPKFWFAFYDRKKGDPMSKGVEGHFGLASADGTLKFNL